MENKQTKKMLRILEISPEDSTYDKQQFQRKRTYKTKLSKKIIRENVAVLLNKWAHSVPFQEINNVHQDTLL